MSEISHSAHEINYHSYFSIFASKGYPFKNTFTLKKFFFLQDLKLNVKISREIAQCDNNNNASNIKQQKLQRLQRKEHKKSEIK